MRHARGPPASPLASPLGKLVVFYPRHSVRVGALEGGVHPLIAGVDVFGGNHIGDPGHTELFLDAVTGRDDDEFAAVGSPAGGVAR
jgi:hypothetical protein